MLLKPTRQDWRVVAHFSGRLTVGVGLAMLIPAALGVALREWSPVVDFIIASALTISAGLIVCAFFRDTTDVSTSQGLVIIALAWLLAMCFGSIPLYLSGHYLHLLDAMFDSMSAFTTTGLVLIQDLDHASDTLNTWRHLMTFVGGQGIVIVALAMLVRLSGSGGAAEVHAGEAREEQVIANVIRSAKAVWRITRVYLVVGTLALFAALLASGLGPAKGALQGLWIFMGAWNTAGYAPYSQSILFYHSVSVEMISAVLMIAGAISFGLHYVLWRGDLREITRNIEPTTMLATAIILAGGVMLGLSAMAVYPGYDALFRKGFFQLVSAHTSGGYMNVYPGQLSREWSALALLSLMIAMGLGGSTSSTAGGIKAMRVGISFKSFIFEVRRIISPESAVLVQKYHQLKTRVLGDRLIRNSLLVFAAYLLMFFGGSMLGMLYGYSFQDALIESTSAAANNGISAGVTAPDMPAPLKVAYMAEMWFGRLEFMAVWAFLGLLVAAWRGK